MNECIGVTPGAPGPSPYFGDGVDGAIHVTSGNTLTLDDTLYASTVQVDAGGTIAAQGYPIFAMVSFTNYGTVHSNGSAASGATPGAAIEADNGGWSIGGAGSTGAGGDSGGAPTSNSPVIIGSGPGGAGGAGTPGNAGGDAGTPKSLRAPLEVTQAVCCGTLVGSNAVPVGTGGGGGGGDGTNSGGGGGGGAGTVLIASPTIVNAGPLSAQGGTGSAATAGNAGGGGGGGGGTVYLIGRSISNGGSVLTSGGAGGAGSGSGSAGASGTSGVPEAAYILV